MAPVGAEHLPPPGGVCGCARGREVVREQSGEDEGPAEALGLGDVAAGLDEGVEPSVRQGDRVDPERAKSDGPDRPFPVRWEAVGVIAAP